MSDAPPPGTVLSVGAAHRCAAIARPDEVIPCAGTSRPCTTSSRPPPTREIRAAALQYVRKISGFATPSAVNREAFDRAVDEVAAASARSWRAGHDRCAQGPRDRSCQGARARGPQVRRALGRTRGAMRIHLVDGTYELFRSHFGAPPGRTPAAARSARPRPAAQPLAAALDARRDARRLRLRPRHRVVPQRAVRRLQDERRHRSRPAGPVRARRAGGRALGVVVWPMVEFEADDALAAAPPLPRRARRGQVVLCSPDKDLAQAVVGDRVVAWDRRRDIVLDEAGVTRSSACRRPPYRTGWRWSATRRTAFPASRAGAPSRPPPSWPVRSSGRHTGRPGRARLPAARAACLVASLRAGRDDARAVPPSRDAAAGRADRVRTSPTSSGAASDPASPSCAPSSATQTWRGASGRPATLIDGPPVGALARARPPTAGGSPSRRSRGPSG